MLSVDLVGQSTTLLSVEGTCTEPLESDSVLVRCGAPPFTCSKGVGADALTEFSIQCLLSLRVPWVAIGRNVVLNIPATGRLTGPVTRLSGIMEYIRNTPPHSYSYPGIVELAPYSYPGIVELHTIPILLPLFLNCPGCSLLDRWTMRACAASHPQAQRARA